MIKSLLIGLDGSPDSDSAVELGLRWASRFDAIVVGLGIIDEPGLYATEAALLKGSHYWNTDPPTHLLHEARRQIQQILDQFSQRCSAVGVPCQALDEVGSPFVQILMEAQCSDLVILGRETHFDYGTQGDPDETLSKVLQDSPRPVVAVPRRLVGGESIVVAYDGSLQAARTLQSFEGTGLGGFQHVHVVSVARSLKEATRHTDRAVKFLQRHQVEATSHPVESTASVADVILNKVRSFDAGLLVMGAYGQPILREFFLGSVTRTLLKESPVPIFCAH